MFFMKTSHAFALLLPAVPAMLAMLAGCASGPARAPGSTSGAPSSMPSLGGLFGSGLSPALEAQRARLVDSLKGTPVAVETTADKRLRIEVPMKFAFDPGRAVVKPPLAAVLEQLAVGFKPHAATTELRIAAPSDEKASAQLVQERAASVRDYLVGRGVPLSRIAGLGRAGNDGLEIALSDRPLNK